MPGAAVPAAEVACARAGGGISVGFFFLWPQGHTKLSQAFEHRLDCRGTAPDLAGQTRAAGELVRTSQVALGTVRRRPCPVGADQQASLKNVMFSESLCLQLSSCPSWKLLENRHLKTQNF